MNREELLSFMREAFPHRSIRLPAGISFNEDKQVLTLAMNKHSVTENMQTDSAAFEGWVLCLKAIPGLDIQRVCLMWVPPDDTRNKHYQRFLYRVNRFRRIFGSTNGWFSIPDNCEIHLRDLRIKDGQKYFLNSPATSGENRWNADTGNEESRLENEIWAQQKHLPSLAALCPIDLQRQLPVGLFEGEVNEDNAVFPGKHSAVDLWGVASDSSDLYVLELKAKGNCKVGAISELLFYAMVLRDEQSNGFHREERSKEGELIKKTKQIKAFLLAPACHPLVTPGVFDLINRTVKKIGIEFGHIAFRYEMEPKLKIESFKRVF